MNFEDALREMRAGAKVRRRAWLKQYRLQPVQLYFDLGGLWWQKFGVATLQSRVSIALLMADDWEVIP